MASADPAAPTSELRRRGRGSLRHWYAMKPSVRAVSDLKKGKLRFGLPGSPRERRDRISAAVRGNRETLRRLERQ